MAPHAPDLGGRILVVEDELMIALDLCDKIEELGYEVMGPAASVDKALRALAAGRPDMALLDENLGGAPATPVAEMLAHLRIPFAVVSGYAASPTSSPVLTEAKRLSKPVSTDALRTLLENLAGDPSAEGSHAS